MVANIPFNSHAPPADEETLIPRQDTIIWLYPPGTYVINGSSQGVLDWNSPM